MKLLFNGHKNYNKFIIVGNARTGTTFLQELINSHSQAICLGELFNPKITSPRWLSEYFLGSNVDVFWEKAPIKFLRQDVFRRVPKEIRAVGFKMTYAQGKTEQENWQNVLPYLIDLKHLKVIHIKRNNKLESHLSIKIARQTKRWHKLEKTTGKDDKNEISFSLDYQECLNYFTNIKNLEQEYDVMFKNHDTIEITYEKIAHNYQEQMGLIDKFLGLEYEVPIPNTYKIQKKPLSKAISNYFELKEKFKATPWYEYFTE
ncbi:MAG: Stf0 family sulfotransferase [Crocosphaera sp.]|nr:Stf0 family sulfotransferase [Crocosphaera sp.]